MNWRYIRLEWVWVRKRDDASVCQQFFGSDVFCSPRAGCCNIPVRGRPCLGVCWLLLCMPRLVSIRESKKSNVYFTSSSKKGLFGSLPSPPSLFLSPRSICSYFSLPLFSISGPLVRSKTFSETVHVIRITAVSSLTARHIHDINSHKSLSENCAMNSLALNVSKGLEDRITRSVVALSLTKTKRRKRLKKCVSFSDRAYRLFRSRHLSSIVSTVPLKVHQSN